MHFPFHIKFSANGEIFENIKKVIQLKRNQLSLCIFINLYIAYNNTIVSLFLEIKLVNRSTITTNSSERYCTSDL